jgi:hypothetical protein
VKGTGDDLDLEARQALVVAAIIAGTMTKTASPIMQRLMLNSQV